MADATPCGLGEAKKSKPVVKKEATKVKWPKNKEKLLKEYPKLKDAVKAFEDKGWETIVVDDTGSITCGN